MTHRGLLLGACVALAVVTGGCGDDGAGGETAYSDIAALDAALEQAGHECALEYEGLVDEEGTETSQCTVAQQPAILRAYDDEALLAAFVDPGRAAAPEAIAFGPNWSIEVLDVTTAEDLAEALGGSTP